MKRNSRIRLALAAAACLLATVSDAAAQAVLEDA